MAVTRIVVDTSTYIYLHIFLHTHTNTNIHRHADSFLNLIFSVCRIDSWIYFLMKINFVIYFQFAASTHGPLDTMSLASEDLQACQQAVSRPDPEADSLFQTNRLQNQDLGVPQISTSSESRARASSTLDLSRASEAKAGDLFQTSNLGTSKMGGDLFQTSDLGTSDFSSSELWPSASPSPFDYSQRYRSPHCWLF